VQVRSGKYYLLHHVHYSGEHWHVNPDGVAVRVELVLYLSLSWGRLLDLWAARDTEQVE
jgi:hypothetical protein